jgi:hypothetical protein
MGAVMLLAVLSAAPGELKPPTEHPVLYGPSVSDSTAVSKWLAAQKTDDGRPAVVRLPVTLDRKSPNGVANARVEELKLETSDYRLGVSLAERYRQHFKDAASGTLWLAGYWEGEGKFGVSRVLGPVVEKGPHFARVEAPFARPEIVALIDKLGGEGDRDALARQIVAAGVDAIPVLIWSLSDGRTYETRDIANRMNLPNGAKVDPLMAKVTVGQRCEELLHRIVTPAVGSPPAGNFKVISTQVLKVDDWRAFWSKRSKKTLAELHAELLPLATKYWESKGTTQTVP